MDTQTLVIYWINLILGTFGAVGNGAVIWTFYKHPCLRTKGLLLIGLLAVADFAVCLCDFGVMSFRLIRHEYLEVADVTRFECLIHSIPMVFPLYQGHMTTILLARDRYKAMSDPLVYMNSEQSTKSRIKLFLMLLLLAFLACVPFFLGVDLGTKPVVCRLGALAHPFASLLMAGIFITAGILISGYYIAALYHLRKYRERVGEFDKESERRNSELQIKITKSTLVILAVYCIFWVFPMVMFMVAVGSGLPPEMAGLGTQLLGICSLINSSVNVFIYSTKSSVIRPFLLATVKGNNATVTPVVPVQP